MIPTGLKLYFGIAAAAIFAAVIGGYASGGDGVGPLTGGYKGGVGDQVSYTILIGVAVVAFIIGTVLTLFRDADAEAIAASMGQGVAPIAQRPVAASVWPLLAAAGVGSIAVGLAVSAVLVGVGIVVLAIVAFEWTMTAWADRATGDPVENERLRDRLMGPIEVPMFGLLAGGVLVLAMSRILLAASEIGAVVVGGIVAVVIFAAAVVITQRPSKNILTALAAFIVVGVLTGGVWGAIEGTREIEHHETPGEETHDESETEGEETHDEEAS